MKLTIIPLLLVSTTLQAQDAQLDTPSPVAPSDADVATLDSNVSSLDSAVATLPSAQTAADAYSVTARGPHHAVWQRVTLQTNALGAVTAVTNSYTELGTCLHYWNDSTASWERSREQFSITADGHAIATNGQYKVSLPPDIGASGAIVELLTPQGIRLQSSPLCLTYHDTASGLNVLIAQVTNCVGELTSSNIVTYQNAFDGIRAGLRYTYTRSGLEQDAIIFQSIAPPSAYGCAPESTRLEMFSEFTNPPTPSTNTTADASGDQALAFGQTRFGRGVAYLLNSQSVDSIGLRKTWTTIGARHFLIESVPYIQIKPLLDKLQASVGGSGKTQMAGRTFADRSSLVAQALTRQPRVKRTASIKPGLASKETGLVLDYQTINSGSNNFRFQADQTYYISSSASFSGSTIFEGGSIIKLAASGATIILNGPSVWNGGPFRPTILTARDDNTCGDAISGSSGSPSGFYGTYTLQPSDTSPIKNVRISYANKAIRLNDGPSDYSISHAQFVKCNYLIDNHGEDGMGIALQNALLYSVPHLTTSGGSCVFSGAHVTMDQVTNAYNQEVAFTNSLFVSSPGLSGGDHNGYPTSANGVFQAIGAASHYLADDTYRNCGNANIDPALVAELKKKTTYAPVLLDANFTTDTNLAPHALRDTAFDYGFHYDPIDYAVSNRTLTNTLVLTNGAVLGTYGALSSPGLKLSGSGKLISEGTPTALNYVVRYNTVQEQATTNWSASSVAPSIRIDSGTATVQCRFTAWSMLGGSGDHLNSASTGNLHSFKDCQFLGGTFTVNPGLASLTNCLFERVLVTLKDAGDNNQWYLYNNLLRGGTLTYKAVGSSPVVVAYDNLFDQTTITKLTGSESFVHGYNGYVINKNRLTPTNSTDKILTNTPVYLSSTLGKYYYPTADGMLSTLINAGSRSAPAATLYHYATTTDQTQEGGTTVDIGFHVVAVDSYGNPQDWDGDGVPDYAEDSNYNGIPDWLEILMGYDPSQPNDLGKTKPGYALFLAKPGPHSHLP